MQSRLGRSLRQEQVDYTYSYTMLFNGFALRTARKNLETIQSAKGVSRAFVAGSYTLPTVEQADTQALQVALATNQFTGKGMTIAVLDTGLDTAHPAFANAPADAKFTKDYVSGILQAADLNAEALMPGVTSDAVVLYTDADQYGDTKPVLNLGDDIAKNGSYDLTFHARNMGTDAAQYDVSVIAMSPAVLEQDGKTYMSSHDEALDVTVSGDKTVTLAAGATGDVKVSVSLSQSQKAKLDAAYETASMWRVSWCSPPRMAAQICPSPSWPTTATGPPPVCWTTPLCSMRIPCLTASSLPSWVHTSPAALPIVWAPICS